MNPPVHPRVLRELRGLPGLAILLLLAQACASSHEGRVARHFDGERWGEALRVQPTRAETAIPEFGLLLGAVASRPFDRTAADHASGNKTKVGGVSTADAAAGLLGLTCLGTATFDALDGDHGEHLEIAFESFLATEGLVEALKSGVGRSRPDGSSSTRSFPSDHAALSFAAATFLGRSIEERFDSDLGYALYLPAAYVAYRRVEEKRHFPSDVLAGAFLGVLCTNWIYDFHRPKVSAEDASPFSIGEILRHVGPVWPITDVDTPPGIGVNYGIRF